MAAGLGHVSPIEIMQYLYYPYLLGAGALLAIAFNYPRKYTVIKWINIIFAHSTHLKNKEDPYDNDGIKGRHLRES